LAEVAVTIVLDALRDTVGREVHRAVRAAIQWRALTVPELRHPELAAYERLDAEGQRAETLRRVRHLLFRAYHTVPFYKVAFDAAGLTPRDIRTLDDLAQVPLLDRASVRAAGNDLASRGRARIGARWNATGGSTGEPLRFLVSRWSDAAIPAADRRIWQWHGIPDGGRIALFWGADRDVPPTDDARRWQN
jgi:phenylacetate-coenzyme A ligase PaaK-like adenylate-forming protein